MNMKVLVTLVLCLFISGIASAQGGVYDASVTLENKDSSWAVLDNDSYSAVVEYNASGETFDWHAYGVAPLKGACYALIYYADKPDRFVEWGGNNPGALISTISTDACSGAFAASGSIELDMNLPHPDDYNINPDPTDEYCSPETDDFDHCCGAKLWMVPCEGVLPPTYPGPLPGDGGWQVPFWDASCQPNILFETDLIWYDDTGVNEDPYITTVYTDKDCYAAGEEITITVTVCDEDGISDLETMIVTANFSEYGVEDLVEFTMVDCENGNCDCICREYTGTVVVTIATVPECGYRYEPEFSYYIVVTDSSGNYSDTSRSVGVESGPCAYMELKNLYGGNRQYYDYDDEELKTLALTHLWDCNTCPIMWWCYYDMFEIYMLVYSVHVYDEYGNYIGPINEVDCCERFTATLDEGSAASMKYDDGYYGWNWWESNRIIIVNERLPGPTTLSIHCVGNDIPTLTQEVEFLMPVSALDVTANTDVLMNCCEGESFVDIDAQIVDAQANSILMSGVDVTLYVNGEEYDTEQTDINGVASFFDVSVEDPVDEVTIRAEAECREGSLILPVVDGPCYLEVTSDAEYMVNHDDCGEPDSMTVIIQLLNDSEVPFLYAGIDIDVKVLYDEQDCREGVSTSYTTDVNGSVTLEVAGTQDNESVTICAKMPACDLRDSITVRIVEPELIELKLVAVEPIMVPLLPDDVQDYEVHCYNQRDTRMCCPNTTYEFAVDNETVCTWQNDYGYTYDGLDNRITAHAIGEANVTVSCENITDTVKVVVEDPCDYVTCEDKCFGYDLWSQVCVDGICVNDTLLEENCVDCGYDPCEDVTCEDKCFGADLYSQVCDDGDCVQGELIQANCPDCPGYDPCLDVDCNDTICVGVDLYNMTCVDGECVADALIEANCPECGYVAPSPRRSGGGGSSGTYPPGWNDDTPATTTNNTTVVDDPEPEATPEPTEKLPARPGSMTIVTDDGEEITITVDEDGNWLPGFSSIFAVLGLLSIAYIVSRRRD